MFLSVIIPIYNCENTLKKCLDSLLKGLPDDSEIIFADDGSEDGSLGVCRSYAETDPRVKVISQRHSGPSKARNLGIRAAQGEYITFTDSDDTVDAERFHRYCAAIRDSPERVDLWISDFLRVSPNGDIVDRVFQISERDAPVFGDRKALLHFLRAFGPYWNVWRCFFRKAFLTEHEIWFPEGYFCAEDLYFMTEVFCKTNSCALYHLPYYYYAVGSGETLSSKVTEQRVEHTLEMIERSFQLLETMEDREVAAVMYDKLTLEFIMKAALIWELKKDGRKMVEEWFRKMLPAAGRCTRKSCRLMIKMMSFFGIRFSSFGLFLLKRVKRLVKWGRLLIQKYIPASAA